MGKQHENLIPRNLTSVTITNMKTNAIRKMKCTTPAVNVLHYHHAHTTANRVSFEALEQFWPMSLNISPRTEAAL